MLHRTYVPRGRRFLQATAVAALTLATAALTGPGAQAATSPATHLARLSHDASTGSTTSTTFTIPAGVTSLSSAVQGVRFSVVKSAAQVPQTISCYASASTPFRYYGGPYGGGEEGLGHVYCSAVVYEIQTEVALFLNGSQVTYNSYTVYSTSSGVADTEYPLSPGNYTTGADGYVTPTYGSSATFIPLATSSTVYLP